MRTPKVRPCGEWDSPITVKSLSRASMSLGGVVSMGDAFYWIESRPDEGGRNVLVRRNKLGEIEELIPAPFNVGSRVHEYGGGAFVADGSNVWFCNYSDQGVYVIEESSPPRPLTQLAQYRYADLVIDKKQQRLIAVREDHTSSDSEPVNELVGIDLNSGRVTVLVSGHDFFSSPSLSSDGTKLAWLAWDHPQMPWNGTELWVADVLSDGELSTPYRVAGGVEESVFQPTWSEAGELFAVSDLTGWWNIYRWDGLEFTCVHQAKAEFGRAQWNLRTRTFAFVGQDKVVCSYCISGLWYLGLLNLDTRAFTQIETPCTSIFSIAGDAGCFMYSGGGPEQPLAIFSVDLHDGQSRLLRSSQLTELTNESISHPEPIRFSSSDGETAHGFYYGPKNTNFTHPSDELPPLIVISHGGPTASATTILEPKIQFWTTRGIAVLDVNYRGSTGYGRAYRDALRNRWGTIDVDDCVAGARYLVKEGRVDAERLAIRGGSSGGYTVLSALANHNDFKAGAVYYGISDLTTLAQDTHKFESKYLEWLIGARDEHISVYKKRSPVFYAEKITCPVIFFHGEEDRVVPPRQTQIIAEKLKARGVPVSYVLYKGEQHGFRRAQTLEKSIAAELAFYSGIFNFTVSNK